MPQAFGLLGLSCRLVSAPGLRKPAVSLIPKATHLAYQLLNQFDLKPDVDRSRFDAAWTKFATFLVDEGLADHVGPLFERQPSSGYDTDEERGYGLMSVIVFRDKAQADKAWAAIEARAQPLGKLHASVFGLVRDPFFTFWQQS